MIFAYIFIVLSIVIIVFQIFLVLGAPLGEYTLWGKFPGKLPNKMRSAAVFQILILFVFNLIVISKSGIGLQAYYDISRIGIWGVFVFFIIGSIMNLFSPSKKEKLIMSPLNIIALICAYMVASY